MYKTGIGNFILKKSLIYLLILTIVNVIVFNEKIMFLGLIIGGTVSIIRFTILNALLSGIVLHNSKFAVIKSIFYSFINILIVLILLGVSVKINIYFFVGSVEGVLMVPMILFIDSIINFRNMSNNNFE